MGIREIRKQTNMTQQKFADYFGIPIHSLQNWEYGVTKPPAYIVSMINRILSLEEYIRNIKPQDIKTTPTLRQVKPCIENGAENGNQL